RTLEQIRTQNPQLAQLDDQTIMVGIYNRDFAGTMTPQQYMAVTGYTPKASGMDYVKSAAAGAGDSWWRQLAMAYKSSALMA
ncbi:hypothetical protein, partial [Chitinimonas sp. BJB300]